MSALRKTDTERAMDYAMVIAVSGDAYTAPNATFGWERHTRLEGRIIGMNTFGASAPLKELQTKFGFQPNLVAEAAKQTAPEEISPVVRRGGANRRLSSLKKRVTSQDMHGLGH